MCPEFPTPSTDPHSDPAHSESSENEVQNDSNASLNVPSGRQIDTLTLSETLQAIVRWMAHQKTVTIMEVATHLQQEVATVQPLMDALVEQGLVQQTADSDATGTSALCHYQLRLGSKRGRQASSSIWNDLGA